MQYKGNNKFTVYDMSTKGNCKEILNCLHIEIIRYLKAAWIKEGELIKATSKEGQDELTSFPAVIHFVDDWETYFQKIFGKNLRGKNAENDLIIDSHGNIVPFIAAC